MVRRTLAKFGLPFEKATPLVHFPEALKRPRNNAGPACVQVSDGTSLETLRPSHGVETRFVTLQLAEGVKWCEVQLFFGAPPRPNDRWKARNWASSNVKFHHDRT